VSSARTAIGVPAVSARNAWTSGAYTLILGLLILNASWLAATALAIFVAVPFAADAMRYARMAVGQIVGGKPFGKAAGAAVWNLAVAIALDVNQTVLLVDLNLRQPGIHEKFGFEPRVGIDDYLRGETQLKDCLVCPGITRLVVLPAREAKGEAAAEIISSPRMTALAKELQNRYADRIIIYDAPPLLTSSDTLGFLPNVDAVLLVARSGRTTKAELEKSAHLLGSKAIVGTLLNAH